MINVDVLLQRACDATSLDDFGSPTFREGLDRLIDSLNMEADLSELGAVMAEQAVMEPLTNRLRVLAWCAEHEDVVHRPIERPIVIVGMARSGTTLLSHLLGKDPYLRSLCRFEALASIPPPTAETYFDDPRYRESVQADEMSELVFPGLRSIHYDPPDAPVECNTLFALEFASTVFTTVYPLPSYQDWLLAADLGEAYAFHERVLQVLQSRMPGTWNLKGPQHALALETLRSRYPDAILIATHRDPAVCTASMAGLLGYLHSRTSASARPYKVGEMTTTFIRRCADGLISDHRDHVGTDRMLHVAYPDLVRDPVGSVRRLYEQMGRELDTKSEAAMVEHVESRTQHQYGVHRYTAEEFGLHPQVLQERFADYREAFGVEAEGPS